MSLKVNFNYESSLKKQRYFLKRVMSFMRLYDAATQR